MEVWQSSTDVNSYQYNQPTGSNPTVTQDKLASTSTQHASLKSITVAYTANLVK